MGHPNHQNLSEEYLKANEVVDAFLEKHAEFIERYEAGEATIREFMVQDKRKKEHLAVFADAYRKEQNRTD